MMEETVKLEGTLVVLLATIGVVFQKMLYVFLEIITPAFLSEKRQKNFSLLHILSLLASELYLKKKEELELIWENEKKSPYKGKK